MHATADWAEKGRKYARRVKKNNKISALFVDINYLVSVYLLKTTSEVPLLRRQNEAQTT
jgi:hypothetical protein